MRPFLSSLILLLAAASVHGNPVNYLTDTRSVRVGLEADSPHALVPHAGATNQPGAPFNDPHLSANGSIGWQEVNGWTAAPTTATAVQDVSLTGSQITLMNSLSVNVGGDPFGFHFPVAASGTVHADAFFQVSFFVASLTDYDYTFDFSPSPTLETAVLTLDSLSHGNQQLFSTSGSPVAGVLQPDTYTLTCSFSSFASGAQAGTIFSSLVMNFAPAVPEPSAGALFLLGLVVVSLRRRRT